MKSLTYLLTLMLFLFVIPRSTVAQTTVGTAPSAQAVDVAAAGRAFIEALAREDFAGASRNFDATMKATFPPDKLQELWKTLNAQVGAFKKIVSTRAEKVQQYEAAFVMCEFEKIGLEAKVVFTGGGQITGLFFAPVIASADTYKSPAYVQPATFQVPGTLSLPVGKEARAAVVLVHGSGPNDRDETVGPNKPFRDLAQGLASRGIAVLRYDKRTKVHGMKMGGIMNTFTVKEETVDDALAAVALLRKTEGIDPRRVFVLGHSLGGTLAPRIAKGDPGIAGLCWPERVVRSKI
jgi:hypothetical protein